MTGDEYRQHLETLRDKHKTKADSYKSVGDATDAYLHVMHSSLATGLQIAIDSFRFVHNPNETPALCLLKSERTPPRSSSGSSSDTPSCGADTNDTARTTGASYKDSKR